MRARIVTATFVSLFTFQLEYHSARADRLDAQVFDLHEACQHGSDHGCREFDELIVRHRDRESTWRREHPEWFEVNLDDRIHELHQQCVRGEPEACDKLHRFVAEHRDRERTWRRDHPDWFKGW